MRAIAIWMLAFGMMPILVGADCNEPPIEIVMPICSDEIDNDGDGLIDYPDDPGCSAAHDTSELMSCLDVYPHPAIFMAVVEAAFANQESIQSVDVFDPDTEVDTLLGAAAILGCDPL